jgi:hypothetical protein
MPDLTISLTPAQATRVATALGRRMLLTDPPVVEGDPPTPRDATLAEAQTFLLSILKSVVREEELSAAVRAANITDL